MTDEPIATCTDYPFTWLGDAPGSVGPVRRVFVLSYDGNKYCQIKVAGKVDSIKAGYIYVETDAGMRKLSQSELRDLQNVGEE